MASELDDDTDDTYEDDEDGGSFADNDDSFTGGGPDDEDEGPEGTFRDVENTFSTPQSRPAQHANRLTDQAAEDRQYETPHRTALQRVKDGEGTLVAKWFSSDASTGMKVAWSIDGKLLEKWRTPTQAEFEKFKAQGRWLKGGVKQAVAGADAEVPATPTGFKGFLGKHKKKIFVVGGLIAAAGGAYWIYRQYWDEADGDVEDSR